MPQFDAAAFGSLVERGAQWPDVLALMDRSAPYGFLNYATVDTQPMMSLAGDFAPCVEYLMGNHTIAERVFRHDPRTMMYAPLRTVIAADDVRAPARFCVEQPSKAFASYGNDDIAEVGVELDHKVATLLKHLDAPVPPTLTA